MTHESPMMGDTPKETIPYSNQEILLVAGRHIVTSERDFAEKKKRIENLGLKFFQRNFTNLYLIEDASGSLNANESEINNFADTNRSFRAGYWHVLRDMSQNDALQLTKIVEQNPVERLTRIYTYDDMNPDSIPTNIFMYAQLTALDDILRKGMPVQVRGEENTSIRDQLGIEFSSKYYSNEEVEEEDLGITQLTFRSQRLAKLIQENNVDLARQFTKIASLNPSRLRLMSSMGGGHMGILDNLPAELQKVARLEKLVPDSLVDPQLTLLLDITKYNLSEEEIIQRIKEII
jgi:hypothetical protein